MPEKHPKFQFLGEKHLEVPVDYFLAEKKLTANHKIDFFQQSAKK